MENFGHRLKIAMADAGLSQRELANRSGLSQGSVSQYLSGRVIPKRKTMMVLMEVLGMVDDTPDEPESLETDPVSGLPTTVSLLDASRVMHKAVRFIERGLITGVLPFGVAVLMDDDQYSYYIQPEKFRDFVGAAAFDSYFLQKGGMQP